MARITGQWSKDTGRKVWKNIRLSINEYTKQAAQDIVHRATYDLERWEADVIGEISDPLAVSLWHKLRDPSRDFPHINDGKQVRSISSTSRSKSTGAGNYSITSWAEIGVPYASFTSDGYPRRADGETPNWVGWLDDVFEGTRGFFSVADVFDRLMSERQGVI